MTAESHDLISEILELKRRRNAVILAHNYQIASIQEVADFVGDSLGLSIRAAETQADVIAFCGVHFMGETAKILNPSKTVVIPDMDAGCSLSDSCPAEKLAAYLEEHRDKNYYVIAYINCSAGVKALADVIVTSGNALKIVEAAPVDRNILFVPDQNLGAWVKWIFGVAVAMSMSSSRVIAFTALKPATLKRSWWPIRNARMPFACWPTRFVRPRRW